ncbi:sulfatase-like hydrolase/transferase [Acuticoccus mangrovi]|uniref:Sulfatase-like hydrolase/transferase n=1 Tax=Acuticoccus mangrovi TaxID=2796142 RepID=A0A934INH1_9HYPH|nr:sulfatase-like hydrolase/transferase [Acuticoccus mangrovi]MBJ3774639.1 sulfatase-like hydrolase/transferase [Acuticoccus mangrovi]
MADAKNLLFIFSDQHARHVTGAYGDPVVATPTLDRLAREGVTFDGCYCPSPICVPSRMAMLTGRWPFRQGCWTNDDILPSSLPTWLHAMGAGGHRPTLIGRLHAIGPDQLHGYAEREVGEHSPNYPGPPRHDLGPLAGANDPDPRSRSASGPGMSAYQAKDEAVTAAAVDWLEQCGREPFCLTVGLMLPHPPYVADAEAYALYEGRVPPPTRRVPDNEHAFHAWWRRDRGIGLPDAAAEARARTAYYGLVHRMDEMMGRLLATLERLGVLDETLVVYASDHGDHIGERGLFWKHTFFDESAAVPLLMRLPGVLPAGERRGAVVNLIDLSQTMLEAMGAPSLPNADGVSFWRHAQDAAAPWFDETFCEYCTDPVPYWTGGRAVQQRMIRRGRYKLSLYDAEPPLLFDLEADPGETRDLADHPAYDTVRRQLEHRLGEGWDAQEIARRMRAARLDKDILAAWARTVRPVSQHVWAFDPAINALAVR